MLYCKGPSGQFNQGSFDEIYAVISILPNVFTLVMVLGMLITTVKSFVVQSPALMTKRLGEILVMLSKGFCYLLANARRNKVTKEIA